MANFLLQRMEDSAKATTGVLYDAFGKRIAATLERAEGQNEPMVSRIPAGHYRLGLKTVGSSKFDSQYTAMFGSSHKGMIEITSVPGREAILFHMGNWYYQSEGCVLVGARTDTDRTGLMIPPGESRLGYVPAYAALLAAVQAGDAWLDVKDIVQPMALVA
jgi:hypothetical protein